MNVQDFLSQYRKQVIPYTDTFFHKYKKQASEVSPIAQAMLDKLFKLHPKGKMHRGALVVLGYQLAGGKEVEEAIKASIAVELTATSILVMDDVVDRDDTRRGEITIHKQWESYFPQSGLVHYGESMGVITSMLGFYVAPLVFKDTKFTPADSQRALEILFESMVDTGYGEALDITTPYQTIEEKQKSSQFIHLYKTVNYSAVMPLRFGVALAGNDNTEFIANIRLYADRLGKVFQIQDDILGSFGNPQVTGKSNDSDIIEARWTALIEILYNACDGDDRLKLLSILNKTKRTTRDVDTIKEMFVRYDVRTKAQAKASAYLYQGMDMISHITTDSDHQDTLKNLLEFMLKREK